MLIVRPTRIVYIRYAVGVRARREHVISRAGIEKFAPHDLARTFVRLCHEAGGELDQMNFVLGHV